MALTVEPISGAPAQVSPTLTPEEQAASSPTAEAPGALPDELLAIPAMQGLMTGQPGAVSASIEEFTNRPEGQLISDNQESLQGAGIGLYRSLDGGTGVLFNSQFVSDQDLKNADSQGKLAEIAPPFDEVNAALGQQPADAGVPGAGGPVTAPPATIGAMPDMAAPASRKAIMAKLSNIGTESPTSGPQPGAGRILNEILKPVI